MFNHQRDQIILQLLKNNSTVRISELSELCGVSEATIRRDLDKLQESGKIRRFHGGAISTDKAGPEPPVVQRAAEQTKEKKRIGEAAAKLVCDGGSIFIGSGTTTEALSQSLKGRQNITVVTNSLIVVNHLAQEENISVILIGGVLRASEYSFIGHLTEQALQELRPNKVFMGIRAISLAQGLTNDYMPEVSTDRVIIHSAPEIILLADHTKFGKVSTAFVAPLTSVHKIITDTGAPNAIIEALRGEGIEVIVV